MAVSVHEILLKRYPVGEFVVMAEVSDAAGFSRSRSADFIVMGLWNSRGLPIIGIEVKSFRGDWLKEVKNPAKAENIYQYCDIFFLLTTDESVARVEEIPITWGWMCIKGERIKVLKEAPALTPKGLSKSFVSCMLRRAADKSSYVHISSIQDKINEARDKERTIAENERFSRQKDYERLKKDVQEFEDEAGIKFGSWHTTPKKLAEAYKFIIGGGINGIENALKRCKDGAEQVIKTISGVLPEVEITENIME